MENKEHGYIKKEITLWVKTTLGDHWKNTEYCDFIEVKGQEGYVVEEREKS